MFIHSSVLDTSLEALHPATALSLSPLYLDCDLKETEKG